ncbi:Uncharacterized protein Rs2_20424 [Raphanus sativus]|nr:Uncharacterized protein Rs2_20424 [Raphanus sativus]
MREFVVSIVVEAGGMWDRIVDAKKFQGWENCFVDLRLGDTLRSCESFGGCCLRLSINRWVFTVVSPRKLWLGKISHCREVSSTSSERLTNLGNKINASQYEQT